MAIYRNFSELTNENSEGSDFIISYRHTPSSIAVIAPHGGRIEPGTNAIADAIADENHSYYGFCGIKKSGNRLLHITSTLFDEPLALHVVRQANIALSIHGLRDTSSRILIGGKHIQMKVILQRLLSYAGFNSIMSDTHGLSGSHPHNICNLCKCGEGVQLELSRGLREAMFNHLDRQKNRVTTPVFDLFIQTVRNGINVYQ